MPTKNTARASDGKGGGKIRRADTAGAAGRSTGRAMKARPGSNNDDTNLDAAPDEDVAPRQQSGRFTTKQNPRFRKDTNEPGEKKTTRSTSAKGQTAKRSAKKATKAGAPETRGGKRAPGTKSTSAKKSTKRASTTGAAKRAKRTGGGFGGTKRARASG